MEVGATITRGFILLSQEKRTGDPTLCFVLHHMGFFVRLRLRERPVGSYPHLFTLTQLALGGIFSVTLSVTWDLHPRCPRFHGACCLTVFGLSSGKTGVEPAITRHNWESSTERGPVPGRNRSALVENPESPPLFLLCRSDLLPRQVSGFSEKRDSWCARPGEGGRKCENLASVARVAPEPRFCDESQQICATLSVRFPRGFRQQH
jgi:hypothetical protein